MSLSPMTCKEALAILVGSSDEFTRETVLKARLHASRCPRCSSAYAAGLSPEAMRVFPAANPQPAPALRVGLFVVAATQLVLAIPWLVGRSLFPDPDVAVSHLTRDGALGLVVAAVGIVTVWRPRYVHATMLIGLVVLALQLVAGIADKQSNSVNPSFEWEHLPVAIIVVFLFAIAASIAVRATPRAKPRSLSLHPLSPLTGFRHGAELSDED